MCRVLGFIARTTHDRQQRDIGCRSICQHHWGPLTGHSVAPLHALRVAATAVWAPAPSFRARGRETARRREEAPSRASPVSNQKKNRRENPNCSQREAQRRSSPRKLFSGELLLVFLKLYQYCARHPVAIIGHRRRRARCWRPLRVSCGSPIAGKRLRVRPRATLRYGKRCRAGD